MRTYMQETLRIKELDALRGIAAFGVLLFHYTVQYDLLYDHTSALLVQFDIGKYGVHLFFMISGFVIFMTLERTLRSMDFVVSRFSRLFPAYWAALVITLLCVHIVGLPGQEVSTRDAVINLTMLSDFFEAREVDGSYWTLQIELFFYIQMLVWHFVGGLPRMRIVIGCWLLLAAAYGITDRFGISLSYTLRELLIVRYIPFFAAGIVLYRAYARMDRRIESVLLVAACACCIWLIWSWREALVLSASALVFAAIISGKVRILGWGPFVFLGTISYTLYLLHQNLGYIVISSLEQAGLSPGPSIAVAAVVAVVMASALTSIVERPAMRTIRDAYRRHRGAPDARTTRAPG